MSDTPTPVPVTEPFVMGTLYAFIIKDPRNEEESVPAVVMTNPEEPGVRHVMPLIGGDLKRVEELMEVAQQMANGQQREIVLYHYKVREEVARIQPKQPEQPIAP